MVQHANIFIPDISGYTEFLTKTALDHSSHIINELLSVLVESNHSDLTLLEIEGDALLFFRKGEPIPLDRMVDQCTIMFTNFHTRLRAIERDTLCRCGACQKASQLTLKFIVHYGQISEIAVSSFVKASGIDMVIAHRLLKNRIDSAEYILVTEQYLQQHEGETLPVRFSWQVAEEEYPVVGRIPYYYTSLEDVKNGMPVVPEPELQPSCICDESVSTDIDSPMMTVYEVITDLDRRKEWVEGVGRSSNEDPLGRLHRRHYCYFGDAKVEIIPLSRTISDKVIDYAEAMRVPEADVLPVNFYLHLARIDAKSTRVEVRVGSHSDRSLPIDVARYHLQTMVSTLRSLKEYCENRVSVPAGH